MNKLELLFKNGNNDGENIRDYIIYIYLNHEILRFCKWDIQKTHVITKLRNFGGISQLAPLLLKYFCSRCFLSRGISSTDNEFLMLNICLFE